MAKNEDTINYDDLVLQVRTDTQALSGLYERYYERIFRFCMYRLFTREAAEDTTSEVFLNVVREIPTFQGRTEQDFHNWLYAIAANLTNAYIRKTTRRNQLLAAAVRQKTIDLQDCDEHNPEFDWPTLYRAILQLKPKHQTVIVLRFFENLTHEQIAAIVNAKPITVRVTLTRALGKLRKILAPAREGDK